MKRRVRIAIYSGVYLLCIVAFFGIANGLGWEIEPEPGSMAYFAALYIGGLVPMWKVGGGTKSDQKQIVDRDKEMKRKKKMGEDRKNKTKMKTKK